MANVYPNSISARKKAVFMAVEDISRIKLCGWYRCKKNELRHSREAPHTNHIINNTKTNNRVQR